MRWKRKALEMTRAELADAADEPAPAAAAMLPLPANPQVRSAAAGVLQTRAACPYRRRDRS